MNTILETDDFISDLERWSRQYLTHIKTAYSDNTIELYERAIRQFIEFSLMYQDEMTLRSIRSSYFDQFLSYLEDEACERGIKQKRNGKYLAKSTKDAYLKAIKGFFIYIADNNDDLYTFDRYFRGIKKRDNSKLDEKMNYLTDDEIVKLLDTLEEDKRKGDVVSYRNALLVKLQLFGGLRISEALGVNIEDFSEGQEKGLYLISIYGKGGKSQTAYIAMEHIEDELRYFIDEVGLVDNQALMRTRSGEMLGRSNAYTIINRIYKRSGIDKKGLHLLRHTLAMKLTREGTDLVVIKKILRHSSIATTTIYARATEKSVASSLLALQTKR